MDKEKFEKKKSILVRNGLSTIKGLEETFKTLLKHDWYGEWDYPDNLRKPNGSKLDPVEFKFLFKRIRALLSELAKFPVELESLWEEGLK